MTAPELETLLYELTLSIGLGLSGSVYKRGLRPIQNEQDSHTEDAVVGVISGNVDEVQKGTCVLNIYVPDILTSSGEYLENKMRTAEIAETVELLPKAFRNNSKRVYFTLSEQVTVLAEDNTHEHFVSLKMDYKVLQEHII